MDAKQLLLKTGLFSQLNEVQLERIFALVKEVTIHLNEIFIHKGESADALYVIEEGVCQVFIQDEAGREIILARLEVGAYLGEQALLTEIPGKRNASVRAISEMKLLEIPHASFQEALKLNEPLKKMLQKIGRQQLQANLAMEDLHQIHISQERGEVRQYNGKFLNLPAMISEFHLRDERKIVVARVLDLNIHMTRDPSVSSPKEVVYVAEKIRRELFFENNVLVGMTSYGEWGNLSQIINMVFNRTPVDEQQLAHFISTGELVVVLPGTIAPTGKTKKIICNCMYISRDEIKKQIKLGATNLESLSKLTGVGSVCGTCRPAIQDILGNATWQAVRIKKILPLTATIHAYQLVTALGDKLSNFKAGQYVVMQCFIDGNWIERAYTLTSVSTHNDYYEIAIQREEKGLFSSWVFRHEADIPLLRMSAPEGKFIPNLHVNTPLVCLMAGIGITPGVAFARTAAEIKTPRPLYIHFSAHGEEDFAYLSELKKLADSYAPIKLITRSTRSQGRLQQSDLAELIGKFSDAEYFICGPTDYEESMQGFLKNLGISENKIAVEKFTHSYDPA